VGKGRKRVGREGKHKEEEEVTNLKGEKEETRGQRRKRGRKRQRWSCVQIWVIPDTWI
jgi:hypothetical protein